MKHCNRWPNEEANIPIIHPLTFINISALFFNLLSQKCKIATTATKSIQEVQEVSFWTQDVMCILQKGRLQKGNEKLKPVQGCDSEEFRIYGSVLIF